MLFCSRDVVIDNTFTEVKGGLKIKKMKLNFRKISAIGASLLMTGMTLGVAAAVAYPAPFIDGASSNVAIVYGTGEGASIVDGIQSGHIQADLQTRMGGSSGSSDSVIGGDSYKFEKTSTMFHLGDGYTTIKSTLDKDELPTLLDDGKFIDNDNDEIDFTQKIVMDSVNTLTMFDDDDYEENSPSIGFSIADAATIATYTITFTDSLLMTDMPTADLPLMGKTYYVLSNTSTTLTLLDSAEETVLSEGETATVNGKTVTIEFIGSAEVKLNIDGEVTNSLAEAETFKLLDGSYVGIKDILYDSKQGSISKVEFSIGSGKLKLSDSDAEVQINDENIAGVESDFSLSANVLTNIEIAWKASDTTFVTETNSVVMPGFEAVTLSFGGLTYPTEETIEVKKGGTTYASLNNFPFKTGNKNLYFLYGDSTSFTGLGKTATTKLLTDANADVNITFDKDTDDYFVASWTDASTGSQSYLMRATNFITESSVDKADIQYWSGEAWATTKSKAVTTDEISLDGIYLTVGAISNTENTVEIWNTSANTATSITSFNTLYSKEGMTVYLPYENTTAVSHNASGGFATAAAACASFNGLRANTTGEIYTGTLTYNVTTTNAIATTAACSTTFLLSMKEEDKSGNVYSGDWLNFTIGWDSSSTAEVEVSGVATSNTDATSAEIGTTDVWRDFTYSALATEILWNKPSSGQKSVQVVYHGDEVAANVRISSADAVITTGEAGTDGGVLGEILYKDSEASNFATKNLIVVGGSCINSAAAALLGGSYCGADFTANAGAGAGEFVIKGYETSSITSELALLVAGYDVADTINAATYLRNNIVDTSSSYKGTSATSAELVVA